MVIPCYLWITSIYLFNIYYDYIHWSCVLIKREGTRITSSTLGEMSFSTNIFVRMTSSGCCCQWLLNRQTWIWRWSKTLKWPLWKTAWWGSTGGVWNSWIILSICMTCWLTWNWFFTVISLVIWVTGDTCRCLLSVFTVNIQKFVKIIR